MPETLLSWPVQALQAQLRALVPTLRVQVLAETGSTNSVLMERVRTGDATPTLLVAEVQTAGRGRLGRSWQQGAAGDALSFSLALPLAPRDWSGLSLAVGVAVADGLHPDIRLKWPNDLWWQGRKLAGILLETATARDGGPGASARWVVMGIGINLRLPQATAPLRTAAVSLHDIMGPVQAPDILQRVARPLLQAVQRFERQGFAPFAPAFARRDALAGQDVWLSDGRQGRADGVAADGALRVQTAHGLEQVRSLEVSVRPVQANST